MAVKQRIQESLEQLADPNSDGERDRFLKGMVWALRDILDAKPALLDDVFEEEKDEI